MNASFMGYDDQNNKLKENFFLTDSPGLIIFFEKILRFIKFYFSKGFHDTSGYKLTDD